MNNSSNDCPPIMSDARFATDNRSSCCVYDLILLQNTLKSSHQARKFLQNNAEELMKRNSQYFNDKNKCNCTYNLVDPNGNNKYWADYQKRIGYKGQKQSETKK